MYWQMVAGVKLLGGSIEINDYASCRAKGNKIASDIGLGNIVSESMIKCTCKQVFGSGSSTPIHIPKWFGWENIGQPGGGMKGDVGVVAVEDGVTDIYVRGMDDTVWQKYYNGQWSVWFQLDPSFKIASSPVVVSHNAMHRDIYATGQDGNIYHKAWDGNWRGWENIGKPGTGIKGDVGVVAVKGGITDIYVRAMNDNTLWQKYYNGQWSTWNSVDSSFKMAACAPVAISANPAHRDIYAKGVDGLVYHKAYDGNWRSWNNIGKPGNGVIGDIGVVAISDGIFDVYVRGLDNALWQKSWTNNQWIPSSDGWGRLDDSLKLASSPVVVSHNPMHRDVYVRGEDGNVYHKYWT